MVDVLLLLWEHPTLILVILNDLAGLLMLFIWSLATDRLGSLIISMLMHLVCGTRGHLLLLLLLDEQHRGYLVRLLHLYLNLDYYAAAI